ncbi:MAG: protoheme IX farnesyltransferase [Gammaproteobacteria bacterium]|nr:MAG: protoheme IX farnesyltransferase [Gammaproteobacteria bacterium]
MFKDYLFVTKPGIIVGNLIAAASGFFLASRGNIDALTLLFVLLGMSLVIASGCVLNNTIDRDIDRKMSRTRNRALASGRLVVSTTVVYGVILGLLGFVTLALKTNWLTVFFAGLGFFVYVGLYSLYYKRSSVYGTLIGSLSGACPPVIGYVSVTNRFDIGAVILLLTFCLWQIPHSYAIAIYRFEDYRAAKIPVLPIEQGIQVARRHMIGYIIGFAVAALMLTYHGYVGNLYALIMGGGSLYWLYLAKIGYQPANEQLWAKKLFVFSIVIIVMFSVLISIDFSHVDTAGAATQALAMQ